MYDDKGFFIENEAKRYSIGSYIQHDRPAAGFESNWLPAPEGNFNLTMRLYGAGSEILDGSYRLPGVKRVA
jgi:hypothetical protein